MILWLACAAAPAWAQPGTPDTSPTRDRALRQIELERSGQLQDLLWRAPRSVPATESELAVQAVLDAVTQGDCPAAVAKLNAGLAKAYPAVVTLAGALYEEGLCLRQNWDRALSLYQRAVDAGHPGAAARVAAGYAAPVGGRDQATALWWALRAKTPLPAACNSVAALVGDADRFVAALNAWPAGQLNACAYAAAVMATIQSEAESASWASDYGLQGKVRFRLNVAQGQVEVVEDVTAATTRESDLPKARQAFAAQNRQLADRALKRYDKPAGIAPEWQAEGEFALRAAR